MKVALCYDRVNKYGGAERVLLALQEIWPQAPLFTAVYDKTQAKWAEAFEVRPSFLQKFPLAKTNHELYPWLTPLAFESFNFDPYDLVISVTSAEAKNIITKPQTFHICYCLTPTRYLWSGHESYLLHPGMGIWNSLSRSMLKKMKPVLQAWDLLAASRPDYYVAISELVKKRIEKFYHRQAARIIYPPVDADVFVPSPGKKVSNQAYYLYISRLVGYKRADLVVEAFNQSQRKLVLIGTGRDFLRLKSKARSNIVFIDRYLTDDELVGYYQNCRALVFAGEEDFGLVAVEAQACGKPVIAYRKSGISEIVQDGKTGVLFDEQSPEALNKALNFFEKIQIDHKFCRENVLCFEKSRFKKKFRDFVESIYTEYRKL